MIAILATGDELTTGDILNTNGPFIAQMLFDHDIRPGMQLTVRDNQAELEDGMRYLLERHAALITIGGLGPTSDDRTRFALANVIGKTLIFDEASWQHIQARLQKLNVPVSESNRQQCLFPEGATILPNENGTAHSCFLLYQNKPIFMLPGPPRECQPLLKQYVLPQLLHHDLAEPLYKAYWMLIGISESHLAQQIDPIAQQLNVTVGYRATTPYIELKLFSSNQQSLDAAKVAINPMIAPYIVSTTRQTAKDLLYHFIKEIKKPITIIDNATHGYLACQLLTPDTYKKVMFPEHPMSHTHLTIIISGMHRYWEKQNCNLFILDILILKPKQPARCMQIKIPNRGTLSLHYATEHLCWSIYQLLINNHK